MTGSKSDDPDAHNFGNQCSRAIATFLTPGSSKELSLDAIVRDTVIRNLSMDCHPDAVWMRGATQLRVWEMQEMDAEAKAFVDGIQDQHTYPPQNAPSLDDKKLRLAESNVSAIAPFSLEAQMSANCPSVLSDAIPSYGTVVPVHNFHRPPVFGPEVVVLDPRIKALHRQILTDTIWIAVWFGLVGLA
ncbi:hypothetical protein C0991_006521 [Blastosporella zonata]|nr:hypothetical protein C0991_006521 [Blastosporella zonata]